MPIPQLFRRKSHLQICFKSIRSLWMSKMDCCYCWNVYSLGFQTPNVRRYDWTQKKTYLQNTEPEEVFGRLGTVLLVDGRNLAPVEVGSLSHYLQGFSTIPGGDRRISEPSTVVKVYNPEFQAPGTLPWSTWLPFPVFVGWICRSRLAELALQQHLEPSKNRCKNGWLNPVDCKQTTVQSLDLLIEHP